ncbi:MAG: hypothetical protein ACP5N9_01080 [Candidatus Bilamarchaeum sp.]
MIKYVLVVLLVGLLLFGCTSPSNPTPNTTGNVTINKTNQTVMADNRTGYEQTQHAIQMAIADGNYEKNVTYPYHSGQETVGIKVSIVNNTLTNVSITGNNPNPISAKIIDKYAVALQTLAVGKKLDQINLPKNVAGSSLTNAAFKQYLADLDTQY